jgi:peptidoglycan-associated lipoprotein
VRHVPRARYLWTACVLVSIVSLVGCAERSQISKGSTAPNAGVTAPITPPPLAGQPLPAEEPQSAPSEVQVAPPPGVRIESTPGPAAKLGTAATETSPLKDVFFEYDAATIGDEQKAAMDADVAWLRAHPGTKVVIEGNCDERGSVEYNLGLGDRRAQAVKDYLVAAGVSANRIATISYGKERPFVLGHDESVWRWNRRAHFALQSK